MPFRPTSVVVHPAAQELFDRRDRAAAEGRQPEQAIWNRLQAAIARVKADGQCGEVIPPRSIPRRYIREFGLTNLYCVDLPSFHRFFYTIKDRVVIVLDLVDHREYDRLMKT
ncbi:MAG: hypothetical protein ACHQ2Y_03505 [Candidatus Lutacidiplasmatales archaeon]